MEEDKNFEIDKNYCENCLETMEKMSNDFVDLVVTSPPYDDLRDYKGYNFDFEKVAKSLFKIIKIGGVVVWIVGDSCVNGSETGTSFRQALFFKEIGFKLHDTMIFSSNFFVKNHNRYEQSFCYMFVFVKNKLKTFNPFRVPCKFFGKEKKSTIREKDGILREMHGTAKKDKIEGNIWYIPGGFSISTRDKIAFKHPAIFPEKLAEKHILSWTNENDLVYDPFMGSGTTAKMAILNKRHWLGSEISPEYCEIIEERIKKVKT